MATSNSSVLESFPDPGAPVLSNLFRICVTTSDLLPSRRLREVTSFLARAIRRRTSVVALGGVSGTLDRSFHHLVECRRICRKRRDKVRRGGANRGRASRPGCDSFSIVSVLEIEDRRLVCDEEDFSASGPSIEDVAPSLFGSRTSSSIAITSLSISSK